MILNQDVQDETGWNVECREEVRGTRGGEASGRRGAVES